MAPKAPPAVKGEGAPTAAEVAKAYLDFDAYGKHYVKTKVDGQELEVSLAEMRDGFQLKRASEKRMSEAARIVKEAREEFGKYAKEPEKALELLKVKPLDWARNYLIQHPEIKKLAQTDPGQILAAFGVDPVQWAESRYAQSVEETLLTPEQRAQRERDRQLERYQREERERANANATEPAAGAKKPPEDPKAKDQGSADTEGRRLAHERVQSEVVEAIKASGRTPSPKLIFDVTTALLNEIDTLPEGREWEFDASQFVGKRRSGVGEVFRHWYEGATAAELKDALGEGIWNALRQEWAKEAKAGPTRQAPQEPRPPRQEKRRSLNAIFPNVRTL